MSGRFFRLSRPRASLGQVEAIVAQLVLLLWSDPWPAPHSGAILAQPVLELWRHRSSSGRRPASDRDYALRIRPLWGTHARGHVQGGRSRHRPTYAAFAVRRWIGRGPSR